jgi:hypothetical protein
MDWFRAKNKNTADVLHISKQDLDSVPEGDTAQ